MSKIKNTHFLILISLLKYSIILLSLIPLPKVKSASELTFIVKSQRANDKDWPFFIGKKFEFPSKVMINGVDTTEHRIWYDLKDGISYNITLTYEEDITSYAHMFEGVNEIKEITFVNFKTAKATNISRMFYFTNFKKIIFQNVDTSAVTDMSETFSGCKNLEELDISTFNTASVVKMNCTFRECENLKVLDLRNFDTSKVTFMFDTFGYCKNLVYINVSSFNTKNIQVMRGIFISCEKLKYIDISNFDFTGVKNYNCANDDSEGKNCRFHYSFANNFELKCLNFINFYIDDKLYDNTFDRITLSNIKFCVNEDNIKVNSLKNSIKNNCNDQCFKDMSKKFDIAQNEYVETCATQKYDFNDLCWEDCPYNYYRIVTDRRTCLKEKPGENYYLGNDNIYYKCYKSCKTCTIQGNYINHNCNQCAEGYTNMNTDEDKYAIANSCYKICDSGTLYYFNSNHEYFCVDGCPSGFKLISEKNKCIDLCTNDDTYKNEYGNTCVKDCPKGTVNINNECKPCYDSCDSCSAVGTSTAHNCDVCKDGYSELNNNKNCYEDCAHYYYFTDKGEYVCLTEDKCPGVPGVYKLIDGTKKCIKNCKDDTIFDSKYEFNGKCYKNCPNGYYTEGNKDICYCMDNITCKDCPSEDNVNNLCSTCNNLKGYYPKREESSNELKSCYDSSTIPKNYILNLTNSRYEPCYETCGECEAVGSSKDHKCKVCREGYTDLNNDNNCYKDCDHYYYFNEQKNYVCLDHDECPQDYKLIITKKKCITNCNKDNIFNYKYEYNGECHDSCSKGSYTEGDQEICYCMSNDTCKDCSSSAIEKNLCSSCNNLKGYYPKKEESSMDFKNCYNSETKPNNYILISNQYEPCYETCGSCDAIGSPEDHKCKDCKDDTYAKLNNDANCYKICSHYYYFNETKGYVCLTENVCPEGYKLIDGTNKQMYKKLYR